MHLLVTFILIEYIVHCKKNRRIINPYKGLWKGLGDIDIHEKGFENISYTPERV